MQKNNNILMILCDQLSASALRSYGNSWSSTINIDRIAADGVIFDHTYTACPLCQPSRASLWTSRYPHQTNVRTNLPDQGFPALSAEIPTIGELFSTAGYQCVHIGKTHDYGSLRGFQVMPSQQITIPRANPGIPFDYETYFDIDTTQKAVDYLHNTREQPFFLAVDLQNPHNICRYIGETANGIPVPPASESELPPLPPNFEFTDIANRPPVIQYLCCAHRRQRQASSWTAADYQQYLYAYYYYLTMVDKQIGTILDTLQTVGLEEDTLIVFLADHGEGMAAHGLVTKYAAFYEETNRVPLIVKGPGVKGNRRIGGVCSLLDLLPTLAELSGITLPPGAEGISLQPQLTGTAENVQRSYVCGEWHDEFRGYTVPGRMICDGAWKYTCYLEPGGEELYDLENDPYEMVNLAYKAEYSELRKKYQELLRRHIHETDDDFFQLKTIGTEAFRQHPLGFCHHEGLSAVELYAKSLTTE